MVFEKYIRDYAYGFRFTDRNMWNYEDGCVLIGAQAMYEATGEPFYYQVIKAFADRYIDEKGTIRLYDPKEYNLDFIPSGRVLFLLYDTTGDLRYRSAMDQLAKQLDEQPRTKGGSFWHKKIYPNQVWLDGLYMALPYYLNYDENFRAGNAVQDVVRQFLNAREVLYDPTAKLYYHAWNETRDVFWADPVTGRSPNFWLRSIGWYLMALADVYELLPHNSQEEKATIEELWREALDGVLARQDPHTGLFYQLPALPKLEGNYLECSGSLMVAASLLKGVRVGVLSEQRYLGAAEEILAGVETRLFRMEDGRLSLTGICKGAGLGPEGNFRRDGSAEYYLSEAIVADEQKGAGVCMMSYAEWIKLKTARKLEPGRTRPRVEVYKGGYDPVMPEEIDRMARQRARG